MKKNFEKEIAMNKLFIMLLKALEADLFTTLNVKLKQIKSVQKDIANLRKYFF